MAPFPNGAGVAAEDAWVLAEERPGRALGAALAWALRQEARQLHLLLSAPAATRDLAGVAARRASLFALPVDVWQVSGREVTPVRPAAPELSGQAVPVALAGLRDRMLAAGATPEWEHGVLTGEVLGLEVCRAVADGTGWRLALGVGKYDREIHDTLRAGDRAGDGADGAGGAALDEALRRVIEEVRRHRRGDGEAHPANTLAPERWLRAAAIAHPELVGARTLRSIETTEVRSDLRQPAPAAASGHDPGGEPVVVAFTAGIVDLEAVPIAADTRLSLGDRAPLTIVVEPSVDARITRHLAAALRDPAAVIVVPTDWRGPPS